MVGPKDLFFAGGIVSGTGRVLNEATPAIATAVALLAPGGISVSYGAGAGAMAAVSSLRIHTFYDTSTTAIDPLPILYLAPEFPQCVFLETQMPTGDKKRGLRLYTVSALSL